MACPKSELRETARIKGFGLGFRDQTEVRMLTGIEGTLPVVNFGHYPAKTPDVNGCFGNFSLQTRMVKQGENLLGFSHGKNGEQDGSAPFEGVSDARQKGLFEESSVLAWDRGLRATRRFHDEGIEGPGTLTWKHQSLSLKV
jgi:hypothetical protein